MGSEIRRVQQEDRAGCGIACLAMVTGRTYADVRESVLASGAETREFMEQMLASCGSGAGITERKVLWWLNREGYFTRVTWRPVDGEAVLPPRGTAILLADSPVMGGHFVVLSDGRVLDPAQDPPADRYAVRQVIEVVAAPSLPARSSTPSPSPE